MSLVCWLSLNFTPHANYADSLLKCSDKSYNFWACVEIVRHQHGNMISDGCTSIVALITACSKSNQVCIKCFSKSVSWIFALYTHCCITSQIRKYKARDTGYLTLVHFDEALIHLMQFSGDIPRNITFLMFQLLEARVATLIGWGGVTCAIHF